MCIYLFFLLTWSETFLTMSESLPNHLSELLTWSETLKHLLDNRRTTVVVSLQLIENYIVVGGVK
jgi:hypothetical protein